jgi:hypothetical protein
MAFKCSDWLLSSNSEAIVACVSGSMLEIEPAAQVNKKCRVHSDL